MPSSDSTSRLRRLLRLPPAERRLALRAALATPAITAALRVFGVGRVQSALTRGFREERSTSLPDRRLIRVVNRVVESHPLRPNCLERSLVLWWLLGRAGIPGDLRLGVRPSSGGRPDFHAWVEVEGQPANDRHDIATEFLPFDAAIRPERNRFA